MTTSPDHPARAPRRLSSAAALWASAAVTAGLLIVQAGRLVGGTPAMALPDLAAQGGNFAVLTADIGSGEDLAIVLDQRSESLLMYRVRNQATLDFKGAQSLRDMFILARAAGNPASGPAGGGGSR